MAPGCIVLDLLKGSFVGCIGMIGGFVTEVVEIYDDDTGFAIFVDFVDDRACEVSLFFNKDEVEDAFVKNLVFLGK